MSLLDTFDAMTKEAAASNEVVAQPAQNDERMEVIEKYASWADETLANERGEGNYTAEDVEKLATDQMEADAEEIYKREKVAEAYEMGQIMYQGFKAAADADNQ